MGADMHLPPEPRILDPCAGDGAIVQTLRSRYAQTHGIELDPEMISHAAVDIRQGDFLTMPLGDIGAYDAIVMNPPFSQALAFVKRALEVAPVVWTLERLTWAASGKKEGRPAFLRAHCRAIHAIPDRISFIVSEKGSSSDACEYAWMRFGREAKQKPMIAYHLFDTLPSKERVRWEALGALGKDDAP